MITDVKYFHEKTDEDFETYDKLWQENIDRMIFLQTGLSNKQRMSYIVENLNDNKDILAVRFPTIQLMKRNKIINDILLGKGFKYDTDKVWYPKELWIYSPMH
jgi:hypothetical protein